MEEKKLEQIEQSKEISTENQEWIKKCTEDRRKYLKSLLEEKMRKGLTTVEKLAKIQPFVEKLESYTWQELKTMLSFWCPNDWFENQGWNDCAIDNPHRYWFADISWLYNPSQWDWVYFRIDTLEWDWYDQEYKKCRPTLKIDGIKITLNSKKTNDTLISNAEAYKRLLKDRLCEINTEKLENLYEEGLYEIVN